MSNSKAGEEFIGAETKRKLRKALIDMARTYSEQPRIGAEFAGAIRERCNHPQVGDVVVCLDTDLHDDDFDKIGILTAKYNLGTEGSPHICWRIRGFSGWVAAGSLERWRSAPTRELIAEVETTLRPSLCLDIRKYEKGQCVNPND